MTDILLNIILELTYFVGVIFLFGFIISLINRAFYRLTNYNKPVIYLTSIVGTPIHELSHAVMCILFGHRVTEINLFGPDKGTGVLGYVRHSYNKKNVYHTVGNYFIGVAPIVVGTLALVLAMLLFLPESFSRLDGYLAELSALTVDGWTAEAFSYMASLLLGVTGMVFSEIFSGFTGILFVLVAACVALHMNLSGADIKSSLGALPIIAALIAVPNLIIGLAAPGAYSGFTSVMNSIGAYLVGMLTLSLVFALVCVAIALLVRGIAGIISRLK